MGLMEQLLGVVQGHWDRPKGHVLQQNDRVRWAGRLQDPLSPTEWLRAMVWGFAASSQTAFPEQTPGLLI